MYIRPKRKIHSCIAARSMNPRWKNLMLCWIKSDTGTQPWKIKVHKQNKYKFTVPILSFKTVYHSKYHEKYKQ
jgi:hypothetical protein